MATGRAARLAVVGVLVAAAVVVLAGQRSAAAGVSPGATQRVSVHDDGSQAVGDASASQGGPDDVAVSGNGRYVAFDDPVPLDDLTVSGHFNVYVRDLQAPGHTVLISRGAPPTATESLAEAGPGETPADGDSTVPSISASGRYVAFETQATNIPDGDDTLAQNPGATDIVICDRDPENTGKLDHRRPDGSMDYRYIYVGRVDTVYWYRDFANTNPTISADGTTVSWEQDPIGGEGPATVVWVTLRQDSAGRLLQPQDADYHDATDETADSMFQPRLSADGRHVVFLATCPSCPPPEPDSDAEATEVDIEDLATGRTSRVDVGSDGRPLTGQPVEPTVSGDGRTVAFAETTLFGPSRVIAVDRDPPARVTVVSRATDGSAGQGDSPALSSDGRYLAFVTNAANMDDGVDTVRGGDEGTVRNRQVVVRDLVVDAARESARQPRLPAELASPGVGPTCAPGTSCGADNDSAAPVLSADGAVVAFTSWADDLVPDDTNEAPDAFARRFLPTVTADPVTFGTVRVGASSTVTAAVREVGFGPVHITGVGVTGPDASDFAVFPTETCSGSVLHETGTCLVSLRFTPRGPGTRQADLVISQAGGQPPVAVPITGGAGPAVTGFQATPDPLVFAGPVLALSGSGPAVITVKNIGVDPLTVGSVRVLPGPRLFAGDYTILGDSCSGVPLPPGGVCQVSVFDTPRGSGDRPGALEFTDTSGVHLVGLDGSGITPAVRVAPAVAPAGRVTTVTGTGWPADYPVRLAVAPLPGYDTLTTVTAADGTFSTPLVIFAHAPVGSWPITGTAAATTLTATTSLLVVLGTYQPPDFTTRR